MRDLETIIVLVLLTFNFVPQRGDEMSHSISSLNFVTQLTNLHEVTAQGLYYCNSNAWVWQNIYQSGIIGITDQLILQNGKSSEVYRRNNKGPKTLPCGTPDKTLTSLLLQPSTITCCGLFDRNCSNIDNTKHSIPTE